MGVVGDAPQPMAQPPDSLVPRRHEPMGLLARLPRASGSEAAARRPSSGRLGYVSGLRIWDTNGLWASCWLRELWLVTDSEAEKDTYWAGYWDSDVNNRWTRGWAGI